MNAGIVVDVVANRLINYMRELKVKAMSESLSILHVSIKWYNIVPILCEAVLHIASYSPPDRS